MAITALPQTAVRLLGSCVTIASSCDLVKELIDNAIDSQATSIETTISPDSIDQIIVRDDGRGIEVEDFDSLGRRSHTSKLKSFDELKTRGGETLGFRGEALAAANSLAIISITTRTRGDPVATRMQLKFGVGGVENTRPISAPVGTTVQASGLFNKLPARKQHALKNSNKTIFEIKDLLRMYALARPYLRLSLKVLGESKYTWSYAPINTSTVHEAALQIFRKGLVTNCVQVSNNIEFENRMPPQRDIQLPSVITIDALIPGPGCDVKSITGKGAHISVDFRPVSSTCGFSKKLLKIFRSHLAGMISNQGSSPLLVSPFIQLNIRCPPCSYDPNVTPLKDEIIFYDEPKLLKCFELLCQKMYAQKSDAGNESNTNSSHESYPTTKLPSLSAERGITPFNASKLLLDSMSLGDAEKLNSLERISRRNLLVKAKAARRCPPQNQSDKHSYISTAMRIKRTVNMARIESNTSEENIADEAVPVQIPLLSPPPAALSSSLNPKICPKSLAAKYLSENIERYFRPDRNRDFSIAVDETATMEERLLAEDLTQSQSKPERLPLQPLRDSTMNEIQGQEEYDLTFIGSRVRDFRLQDTRVEVHVPPTRRRPMSPDMREATRFDRSTPPNSSPMSLRVIPDDIPSPRMHSEFTGIRTPPLSNTLNHERNPNPLFRSRRRNTGARDVVQERGNDTNIDGSGAEADSLRQARTLLGRVADGNTMLQGTVRSDVSYGLVPAEEPPHTGREDAPHSILFPSYFERRRPQRQAETFLNALSLTQRPNQIHNPSQGYTEGDVQQQQPQQYSHLLQTLLMRSPRRTSVKRRAEDAALMDDRPPLIGIDDTSPVSTHSAHDSNNNLVSGTEVAVDPDHHVIKRQRLRSHHDQPRQHSSGGLLLETTPTDMQIQNVLLDFKTRLEDIGRSAHMMASWEPYILPGGLEAPFFPLRTMDEVQVIEDRLREIVDRWARNEGITVEYTIRSTAKGKRVA